MRTKFPEIIITSLAIIFLLAIIASVIFTCVFVGANFFKKTYSEIAVWNPETNQLEEYEITNYRFRENGVEVKVDGEWYYVSSTYSLRP